MSGWQLIETMGIPAQKYSLSDVVLITDGQQVVAARRYDDGSFIDLDTADRDGDYLSPDFRPTHWMPLPTPPVQP